MTTNAEMLAEIRKPGKVEMPVLMNGDVLHVIVEKSDLIAQLAKLDPNAACAWRLYGVSFIGKTEVRTLDVA